MVGASPRSTAPGSNDGTPATRGVRKELELASAPLRACWVEGLPTGVDDVSGVVPGSARNTPLAGPGLRFRPNGGRRKRAPRRGSTVRGCARGSCLASRSRQAASGPHKLSPVAAGDDGRGLAEERGTAPGEGTAATPEAWQRATGVKGSAWGSLSEEGVPDRGRRFSSRRPRKAILIVRVRSSVARRCRGSGGDGAFEVQPSSGRVGKRTSGANDGQAGRSGSSVVKRGTHRRTEGLSLQASRSPHVTRVLVFEMWVAEVGPKHLWVLFVRSQDRAVGSLAGCEPRRPLTRRRGASQANGCTKLLSSRVQPWREASIRGGNPRRQDTTEGVPDRRSARP